MKGITGGPVVPVDIHVRWNNDGGKCPACNSYDKPKGGVLVKREARGSSFLGCSRYPECKFTQSLSSNDRRENEYNDEQDNNE